MTTFWEWAWFIVIFVLYIIVDFAWAYWTAAVQDRKAGKAANYAFVIMAIGLVGGWSVYTMNFMYALAMLLGSWIGTYWAVKRLSNEQKSS